MTLRVCALTEKPGRSMETTEAPLKSGISDYMLGRHRRHYFAWALHEWLLTRVTL